MINEISKLIMKMNFFQKKLFKKHTFSIIKTLNAATITITDVLCNVRFSVSRKLPTEIIPKPPITPKINAIILRKCKLHDLSIISVNQSRLWIPKRNHQKH
ncbi:hypothetical protein DERP_009209 [Dermatophagoides pteronyssinus]|uniref:Uncharacterized protein n=1 Tax=Dermatophagoides pteronyssinus TaxID=6956 RepID=A0ABQ8JQU6_DERPT|nr:hypothetical protein DERP_009209 [Dermatophagoides pteronyssinus]